MALPENSDQVVSSLKQELIASKTGRQEKIKSKIFNEKIQFSKKNRDKYY